MDDYKDLDEFFLSRIKHENSCLRALLAANNIPLNEDEISIKPFEKFTSRLMTASDVSELACKIWKSKA